MSRPDIRLVSMPSEFVVKFVVNHEGTDSLPKENPNGSIKVASKSDPDSRTYSPEAVSNLPTEFVKGVTITCDMTREDMAEVIRILKPDGKIKIAKESSAERTN